MSSGTSSRQPAKTTSPAACSTCVGRQRVRLLGIALTDDDEPRVRHLRADLVRRGEELRVPLLEHHPADRPDDQLVLADAELGSELAHALLTCTAPA